MRVQNLALMSVWSSRPSPRPPPTTTGPRPVRPERLGRAVALGPRATNEFQVRMGLALSSSWW